MKNTAAVIYKWLYERNKMMHQMVGVWKDCSPLKEENFCVLYRRKMREEGAEESESKTYNSLLLETYILVCKV